MRKLRKYENPKVKKAWKFTTLFVSIFVFVPCLALMTFGVLYLAGVVDLTNNSPRTYTFQFRDSTSETIYYETTKVRGEKFEYTLEPQKSGYKFRGWDLNGDNFADIIPHHVYKDINARALWSPLNVAGGLNASR